MDCCRLRWSIPSIVLLCFVVYSSSYAQVRGYFPKPGPDETVEDVSVIQLIAQPEKFDGKRVRFIGFLRLEFEGDAIYLHREDFEHGISRNGLWINVPSEMTKPQRDAVNMRYVICVGIFRAGAHGHMGMFSREITDVRRLEFWSDQPRSTKPMARPPR